MNKFKNCCLNWFYKVIMCLTLVFSNLGFAQNVGGGGEAYPNLKTNVEALEKFQNNKFGMFIHWGPVVLRGTEISWSRGVAVEKEDYDNLYKEFNPVLFNAEEWVNAAKDAGMKYIVITARHHDGFSLWDSEFTEYDMKNTPYGKGVLKELSEACKKAGIDFGIYYSICDWRHEDYPVQYPDENYKFHLERKITDPLVKKKMDSYVTFMKNQLKELIEEYDPTLIWFDGEWEWAWTHEMGMDLYAYLRGLKDDLLINNRVDKGRDGMAGTTKSAIYAGDYGTPEREVGAFDISYPWESCITIAQQWAWKANDKLKPKKQLIETLVKTAGGNGNLLLNVGPMADGRIEQRQIVHLKDIGSWLKINGESIYNTTGGPYLQTDNFVSTHKDNKIYIHLMNEVSGWVKLNLPKGYKIKSAQTLNGSRPVTVNKTKGGVEVKIPQDLPKEPVSVIELVLNKSAQNIELLNFETE